MQHAKQARLPPGNETRPELREPRLVTCVMSDLIK